MNKITLILLFTFYNSLFAQLTWTSPEELELIAEPYGDKVAFSFNFKNNTKFDIEIFDVRPSCNCTVANSGINTYKPESAGSINGIYSVAGKSSFAKVNLVVRGAQIESDSRIPFTKVLTLKVTTRKYITLDKQVLVWKKTDNDNIGSKQINVEIHSDQVRSIDLDGQPSSFSVSIYSAEQTVARKILIKPINVDTQLSQVAVLNVTLNGGKVLKYYVHLLIR